MKIKVQSVCTILLAVTMLGVFAGCSTVDYYRLGQTRNDIDAAMTRYRNQVAFAAVAPYFQTQVNAAYQSYTAALDAAVKQAHGNYDAPTPPNVKQQADQLLSILGAIPAAP
jgi:hypothetical protein